MAKKPDFEKQMQRLAAVVQELEQSDITLERNVALYKEGRTLAASCRKLLEEAKYEILLCDEEGRREFPLGTSAAEAAGSPDPADAADAADAADVYDSGEDSYER